MLEKILKDFKTYKIVIDEVSNYSPTYYLSVEKPTGEKVSIGSIYVGDSCIIEDLYFDFSPETPEMQALYDYLENYAKENNYRFSSEYMQ